MNVDVALALVDRLLKIEGDQALQQKMQEVLSFLQQVAGNPGATHLQTELASRLDSLEKAELMTRATFTSYELDTTREIGGEPFFLEGGAAKLRSWLAANPVTPSVAVTNFQDLIGRRDEFLQHLRSLQTSLRALRFQALSETGKPRVAISVPAELSEGTLKGLSSELAVVDRIVQFISQSIDGAGQELVVESISTSIPRFVVLVAIPVATALAETVSWGMNTWHTYEQVQLAREQTRATRLHTEQQLQEFFDRQLQRQQEQDIRERARAMVSDGAAPAEQRREIEERLIWALDALMGRLQRGLRIELILPPPTPTEPAGVEQLRAIAAGMIYAPLSREVLRELPPPEPPQHPTTTAE